MRHTQTLATHHTHNTTTGGEVTAPGENTTHITLAQAPNRVRKQARIEDLYTHKNSRRKHTHSTDSTPTPRVQKQKRIDSLFLRRARPRTDNIKSTHSAGRNQRTRAVTTHSDTTDGETEVAGGAATTEGKETEITPLQSH